MCRFASTFRLMCWCAAAALCFAICGASSSYVVRAQNFTVSGTKILDPNGREFVVKGTNVNGANWVWDRSTVGDADMIANKWKFNFVRVNCKIQTGGPTNNNDLDAIVNAFTPLGVVVMFEVHDKSGGFFTDTSTPSLTDLVNWWRDKAQRFKNNPYVWFNVMNEPGYSGTGDTTPVTSTPWYSMHKTVVLAIREEGANNIIVCDGYSFAAENGRSSTAPVLENRSAVLTYGQTLLADDPAHNIVYSLHTYNGWNASEQRLADYIDRVHAKGLAIFVGEYAGAFNSSVAADYVFRVCVPRKVGRVGWHWFPGDNENQWVILPTRGAGPWEINRTDGSRPTNLTWIGEKIWDDNHNLAAPPVGYPLNKHDWTATASNTQSGNSTARAIDNWPLSIWKTGASQAVGQYFQVNLGKPEQFNQIEMDPRQSIGDFVPSYEVYVSNDGTSWNGPVATGTGSQSVMRVTFPMQTAQYIRVVIATANPAKWWAIAEFNVYSSDPAYAPRVERSGAALNRAGWTASASVSYGGDTPQKALDGNPGTRWANGSSQSANQYFQVDMGAAQTFNRIIGEMGNFVDGYGSGGHFRRYQIFVSNDGVNWGTPIAQGVSNAVTDVSFPAQTARYIRVVSTRNHSDWIQFAEFNVYEPLQEYDTTDTGDGTITARGENPWNSTEHKEQAFDNNPNTKWLDFADGSPTRASWIQYMFAGDETRMVTRYTITSANDRPERDPRDWKLYGVDAVGNLVLLDTRTSQTFIGRLQKKSYAISNNTAYRGYRLVIDSVANPTTANSIQLSEIELIGR